MGEKAYDQGKRKSSDETATEINYKASVTNQTIDLANRVFRRKLGVLYQMAWDLLCDKDEDMEYMQGAEFKALDEDVKDKVKNLKAKWKCRKLEHSSEMAEKCSAEDSIWKESIYQAA